MWAFVVKDFRNDYRFRSRLIATMVYPVIPVAIFYVAYSAVFNVGNVSSIGFMSRENYDVYLLSGFIAYSFVVSVWGKTTIIMEKYMLTLEGIMLAPVSRFYLLFSKGVKSFIETVVGITPLAILLLALNYQPTSLWNLLLAAVMTLLGFAIVLSIDFIVSALEMSNEGISYNLRVYGKNALLFLGCVYYPIDVFPEVVRPLVYVNPVYHVVEAARGAFMEASPAFSHATSLAYMLALAAVTPYVAVKLFEWIFKRYSIRGY